MIHYFTREETITIGEVLNKLNQAIIARLLHFNGRKGKVGTQWKTDPIRKLAHSFYNNAAGFYGACGFSEFDCEGNPTDDLVRAEDRLVDALAMGMMLFDRIQMAKALEEKRA